MNHLDHKAAASSWQDQKNSAPFEHYSRLYQNLDPAETSQRSGLVFDRDESAFKLRLLGKEYRALYPAFTLQAVDGTPPAGPGETILILRYLCEGKYFPPHGKSLSYHEIPWGAVYYRNFEGRCLKRCAFTFGTNIPAFKKTIQQNQQLRPQELTIGDASYRLEFINDLYITIILWAGDDEFPPSAQMLFDDNIVFAFTAEDLAVAGEILVERLKELQNN